MNRSYRLTLVTLVALAATACNSAVPEARTAMLPCPEAFGQQGQGQTVTNRLLSDPCDPSPPPAPPPAPPAAPIFQPMSDFEAQAADLGISREAAMFPDVATTLARAKGDLGQVGVARAQGYPLNATSRTDFVQKLFANGTWITPPIGVTPIGSPVLDPNCTRTRVSETYRPDKLVAFGLGEDKFYPGSLIQGRWVNLGGPSLLPISLPASQRQPISLFSTQLGFAQTSAEASASGVTVAIAAIRDGGRIRFPNGVPSVGFASEVKTASSLQEAMVKFGYDASFAMSGLSASGSSSAEAIRTGSSNTVFIQAVETSYQIAIDLRGQRPENGLPLDTTPVSTFEQLGASNDLGYDNLPTYSAVVTYGRKLIVAMESTESTSTMEATLKAAFKGLGADVSTSLTTKQKRVISSSSFTVFQLGGSGNRIVSETDVKNGEWRKFFTDSRDPYAYQPLSYEIIGWDRNPAKFSRTTEYELRTCRVTPIDAYPLRLNNIYTNVTVTHTPSNSSTPVLIYSGSNDTMIDLGQFLTGDNDAFTISVTGGRPSGFLSRWQWQVGVNLKKNDDNPIIDDSNIGCKGCNSADAARFRINRTTGQITFDYLHSGDR